jgi:hypothetical protein
VIADHYQLSKLQFRLSLQSELARPPLLVYQMGKVGSTTVLTSLKAAADVQARYSIHHVHWLSPARLRQEESVYKRALANYRGPWLQRQRFYPQYVWLGQTLSGRIRKGRSVPRWTIITLCREPIARNMSSFFQNLETLLSYDYRSRLRAATRDVVLEELRRLYCEKYLDDEVVEPYDANPLNWFDRELKTVFDVDVYAEPFCHERGYMTYETPRARVLLLRLKDFARHHGEPVKAFLGSRDVRLLDANTRESKAYADVYETFSKTARLPIEYVDRMYRSKYARHFYTQEEIARFYDKWSRRPT